jgi:hypothetical protein
VTRVPGPLFILAVGVVICLGIVHGTLMLLSPVRHRRLVAWITHGFRRSGLMRVAEDAPRGFELQYRLAGLTITLMCGWLAWNLLNDVMNGHFKTPQQPIAVTPFYGPGGEWAFFVIGLFTGLTGFYFLRRPERAAQWAIKDRPVRRDKPLDSTRTRTGMRIFGLCFVAVSVYCFWTGVSYLIHHSR